MRVGKYQVVRRLATGGMAEVFLAKAAGPMGFEKTLVVKRILPHLAEDPAFVEMFLSEAKLAAQLNHPNIVQIFDFGEADDTYFLAMEYIDGLNLREIIRRASGLSLTLQVALCARIIAAACDGLAFAHDFWDLSTGQELSIVHRDISPDNILLSRQGAVKVVDFGIAKAAGLSPHTQTGVLKGKLAYMPPEYLRSQSLDRRVDVYSLGVVFYELITGQKPLSATSEAGMIQAILYEEPVPAEQRRPDVPQAVQRILTRVLAKDRENRYPDCFAFQEDLEDFILSTAKPMGASQLAQIVSILMTDAEGRGVLPHQTGTLRGSLRNAPPKSPPAQPATVVVEPQVPLAPPILSEEPSRNMEPTSIERPPRLTGRFAPPVALSPAPQPELPPELPPLPIPAPPARKAPAWVGLMGVVLFLAGGGYVIERSARGARVDPPAPQVIPSTPPGRASIETPTAIASVVAPPPNVAAPLPPAPPVPESSSRDGGSPLPPVTPGLGPGDKPKDKLKDKTSIKPPPELSEPEEEEPGSLVVQVEPETKVLLDGWQWGKTPLAPRELGPGNYTLEFINDQLGKRVKRRVRVSAGQVTFVKVNLSEE